jgi:hypothetical protein
MPEQNSIRPRIYLYRDVNLSHVLMKTTVGNDNLQLLIRVKLHPVSPQWPIPFPKSI